MLLVTSSDQSLGILSSYYPALWLKWSQNAQKEAQLQPSHCNTLCPFCGKRRVWAPANLAFSAETRSCPKIEVLTLDGGMDILWTRVSGMSIGVFLYHNG